MVKHAITNQTTVQAFLEYAKQIWPNFGKFVAKKEMTKQELSELDRHISTNRERLKYIRRQITYIFTIDSSEDSIHYLVLGIDAIERMHKRIQRIKRQNEQQLMEKYGPKNHSFLSNL